MTQAEFAQVAHDLAAEHAKPAPDARRLKDLLYSLSMAVKQRVAEITPQGVDTDGKPRFDVWEIGI